MKVGLTLDGTIAAADRPLAFAPTLVLLEALAAEGSLRGAAARLDLSYRSAWGRFQILEAALGQPVIRKTKGHGTVLTAFGAAFHRALGDASRASVEVIAREERRLEATLAGLVGGAAGPLTLAVSHDSVLLDALREMGGIAVTIAGSMDALSHLKAGRAEGAGFHFGAARPDPGSVFADILADPALLTRPVLRREQGLMLERGNPFAVSGITDLTRGGIRFVNRQLGAGTRIWFDRLCAEAGIGGSEIRGYETEEFTHQAVAAMIASGAADVGMGTRAVAERFELDYLPLGEETYFLAVRTFVGAERLDAIASAIRRRAEATPGYG
ncbi:substrate-binding domain-containing protein [Methylobacterium sp. E-045]|uniref:helix-turn-helix transcriptional regulator n=1 Tax=Methylobacterium sp. E-045 TaxID=2836575 RepID=UPI001FB8FED9|nr:substrate-binding domain-containing protein [Methylobacterium sp. E-045]MCJ2129116.1 helix-turn-helix transcriptional regulator [Methylobacterium sp. E-045]